MHQDRSIRKLKARADVYKRQAIAETGLPESGRYEGLESIHLMTAEGAEISEVTDTETLDDNTTLYLSLIHMYPRLWATGKIFLKRQQYRWK